jgi:predicted alpha/beta-fold hydrolase
MILAMCWAAICEYFRGSRRPVRTIFMNLKNAAAFTHFSPCRWIPHSLGQVLASRALARAPKNPTLSRKHAGEFGDGTPCILDVAEPEPKAEQGTIFFCPGFSGSIESPYVQWFVHAALQRGYVVVVYNRRAHTPESRSPTYPLHYQPDDLDTAIAWTVAQYGRTDLYGVGVSAGGNLLMRAAAQNPPPFKAIVSVCNGFDIEKGLKNKNPLANAVICSFVREVLQNVAAPSVPPPPPPSRLNTMTDLEEWALAKFNGQNQPMPEYYRACSCAHVISDITTPTLCINSLDDTLIPHPVEYYTDLIRQNKNISIILTSHGGHVGYLDKAWRCDWWCENALDFIEAAGGI